MIIMFEQPTWNDSDYPVVVANYYLKNRTCL